MKLLIALDEIPQLTQTNLSSTPGLTAITGTKSVELAWDPVSDADLASYRVYRNGTRIADGLQVASYSDRGVMPGAKYSYQISAVDQAGNESVRCAPIEVTMEE